MIRLYLQRRNLHMFGVLLLLSMNYAILRSVRNTVAVVGLGKSAYSIPFFELFGVLPAAFLMTWILSRQLSRHSPQRIFSAVSLSFTLFFLTFALFIYPALTVWQEKTLWNPFYIKIVLQSCSMVYYIMAELWQPALINILFWGFINAHVPKDTASQLYPFLLLGSCTGALLAGPVIMTCTAKLFPWHVSGDPWINSFVILTCIMACITCLAVALFQNLTAHTGTYLGREEKADNNFKDSLHACFNSKALKLMSWIVIAEYVAYALGEVIFLDVLKLYAPAPCDYCSFMGRLSIANNVLTMALLLFITPVILRKYKWVVSALVLPITLLVIELAFFICLRNEGMSTRIFGWTHSSWLQALVLLGAVQYCVCRSMKYTFSDASKELAFVAMPDDLKMRGKLIVDGICSRLGRGGASALSLSFINFYGGSVIASSSITGLVAVAIAATVVLATRHLGLYLEHRPTVQPSPHNWS